MIYRRGKMIVWVSGSRQNINSQWVFHRLREIHSETPIHLIVHGGARGVDSFADAFAQALKIPRKVFYANWNIGKFAGMIRNQEIVDFLDKQTKPCLSVFFWDGASRGTWDSIKRNTHPKKVFLSGLETGFPENQGSVLDFFEESSNLTDQLITYLGNKRRLLPFLRKGVEQVLKKSGKTRLKIMDGFSGSGVVARFLKQFASEIHANDMEYYSYVVNKCYLSNRKDVPWKFIQKYNTYLNNLLKSPREGFITEMYAPKDVHSIRADERVFYTPENARIIDTLAQECQEINIPYRYYFLAPLLHKASVHVNTSGIFKGFYKDKETKVGKYGGSGENALSRITQRISLPLPVFGESSCPVHVHQNDIMDLWDKLESGVFDLVYYDPPYNQHPYGSNYFMLNLIAKYEKPEEVSKVSGIPKHWNKSDFNYKKSAKKAFSLLLEKTKAHYILISYNNEGLLPEDEFVELLEEFGSVSVMSESYPTFRGCRNLQDRDTSVKELLFLVERKNAPLK
jgi:adenine-specific DNA-methyltransferase